METKKNRLLAVKQFLEEYSDELHPVTARDILTHLSDKGITANRRTVMHDIEQLENAGVDVICNRYRQNQYYIGDVLFETPELKLLIDAVQASKFLTVKRSRALIDKLLSLTSRHQADSLKSGLYLDGYIKPKNEKAYITADTLLQAINAKCRVRFKYIEYTPDKKKVYKHGQRVYELSPWHLVWDSDKYYVIGHSKHHGKAVKFRVDRIAAPEITDLPAVPAPEDFDLAAFVRSVFQMYEGPLLDITLKCRNDMMKTIIDRFGEDVKTNITDPEHFTARVTVAASKTFYGWIFGMDGAIKITAPAEAVSAYRDMLKRANLL